MVTTNPQAYKLYLMARQLGLVGNAGAARTGDAIVRLCQRATELDPGYARAWALRLDPESYEVNYAAARSCLAKRDYAGAIVHFEKAASLVETDYAAAGMLPRSKSTTVPR